jgi:hypothetical protein
MTTNPALQKILKGILNTEVEVKNIRIQERIHFTRKVKKCKRILRKNQTLQKQ